VIEVDGHYHNHEDAVNKDQLRDTELAEHGLTVIRFSENEIKTDIANILRTLEQHITEHTSSYQEHTI
jgi:very-short-patch-repair endonuclease